MHILKPLPGILPMPGHTLADAAIALWLMNSLGNRIFDLSGNVNTGIFNNGPVWSSGMHGSAILFDGTDDYGWAADHADWDFGTSPFTVHLRVRFNSVAGYQVMMGTKWAVGDRGWILYVGGGNLTFGYSTDGSDAVDVNFAWSPSVDTWYHVTVVRNGADLKVFINDTQIGSTYNIGSNAVNNWPNDKLYFGTDTGGASWLNGLIEYVYLFNRALTASEIALLCREPFCMFPENIMAEFAITA